MTTILLVKTSTPTDDIPTRTQTQHSLSQNKSTTSRPLPDPPYNTPPRRLLKEGGRLRGQIARPVHLQGEAGVSALLGNRWRETFIMDTVHRCKFFFAVVTVPNA